MTAALLSVWTVPRLNGHSNPSSTGVSCIAKKRPIEASLITNMLLSSLLCGQSQLYVTKASPKSKAKTTFFSQCSHYLQICVFAEKTQKSLNCFNRTKRARFFPLQKFLRIFRKMLKIVSRTCDLAKQ